MPKITFEDLDRIEEKVRKVGFLREADARAKITVHMGTCGIAAGANEIMNALTQEFERRQIQDVMLTSSGCAGLCSREPMATVEVKGKAPVKYVDLTADKIRRILDEHALGGKPVKEYALAKGSEQLC